MAGVAKRQQKGNLPAGVTSFVGRRREAADVVRLLSSSRLVTLTGVPGVGKSRLAVHAAERLRRAFPDGVWLADMVELTDPDLLVLTVMHTVGLRTPATGTASELIDYFRDRQLLLVLDNCEHMVAPCAALVGRLLYAAPGLHVLATSREPLGVAGEHTFEVAPLSLSAGGRKGADPASRSEAVTLFAERAAAAAPGFAVTERNRQAVVALCRRLDGLPLAIELAAGRVRALSVEQIVDRLDGQRWLMTGTNRGAVPRHQTLRAAMDWSHQLCSEPEQVLWARLAVFTGGFDLDAVEAVCGGGDLPHDAVVESLIGLVNKSVVAREGSGREGRYRMLETLRHYAHERLRTRGEESMLRRRHRDHYLGLAERFDAEWFGPDQAAWVARLRAEHADLRVALNFCLTQPGESRAGVTMAAELWFYWLTRGGLHEGRHWLDRGLAMDTVTGPERIQALWVNGDLALHQGETLTALAMMDRCRDLARETGDHAALARAASGAGAAELFRDNPARAVALLEEGLAVEQDLDGSSPHAIMARFMLAVAVIVSGDLERAVALLEDCVARCAARDERGVRSSALMFLGISELLRGRSGPAEERVGEAIRVKREINDELGIAYALEILAWIAAAGGEAQRAALLFGASRHMWQPKGVYLGRFHAYEHWHDQGERQARGVLGDAAFEVGLRRGAALGFSEALAYALHEQSLRSAPGTASAEPQLLTRRETEVARLVAKGLSNKGIAADLVIAPRTAESHVDHILTKLGFTSRAQIAAWVTERGAARSAPGQDGAG